MVLLLIYQLWLSGALSATVDALGVDPLLLTPPPVGDGPLFRDAAGGCRARTQPAVVKAGLWLG